MISRGFDHQLLIAYGHVFVLRTADQKEGGAAAVQLKIVPKQSHFVLDPDKTTTVSYQATNR